MTNKGAEKGVVKQLSNCSVPYRLISLLYAHLLVYTKIPMAPQPPQYKFLDSLYGRNRVQTAGIGTKKNACEPIIPPSQPYALVSPSTTGITCNDASRLPHSPKEVSRPAHVARRISVRLLMLICAAMIAAVVAYASSGVILFPRSQKRWTVRADDIAEAASFRNEVVNNIGGCHVSKLIAKEVIDTLTMAGLCDEDAAATATSILQSDLIAFLNAGGKSLPCQDAHRLQEALLKISHYSAEVLGAYHRSSNYTRHAEQLLINEHGRVQNERAKLEAENTSFAKVVLGMKSIESANQNLVRYKEFDVVTEELQSFSNLTRLGAEHMEKAKVRWSHFATKTQTFSNNILEWAGRTGECENTETLFQLFEIVGSRG